MKMYNMVTFIYLASNILYVNTIYCFIDNFLKKLRVKKIYVLAANIAFYILISAIYLFIRHPEITIICNVLLIFLFCLLYSSPVRKKMLATVFICIITILSEAFVLFSISTLRNIDLMTSLQEDTFNITGIILSKITLFIFVKVFNAVRKSKLNISVPIFYWFAIFLIPLGSAFVIQVLYLQSVSDYFKGKAILLSISVIVMLIINILIFYLYDKIIEENTAKTQNILLMRQVDDYAYQISLTESFQEEMRLLRHDLKNHFTDIQYLAQHKDCKKIEDYMIELIGILHADQKFCNSGNIAIDAILNHKIYNATQNKIRVDVDVIAPKDLLLNQLDMCILLGNLIDNSIEACMKVDENQRFIKIHIEYSGGNMFITVTNSYDGIFIYDENLNYTTTKANKLGHGLGLKNIQNVIERYNGGISISSTESLFTVDILLYQVKCEKTSDFYMFSN
ncbi:GHKL domain-containing protein [Oscillospiraceae bacterium PP1C4]